MPIAVYQDDKAKKLDGVKSLIKWATMCQYMLIPTEEEKITVYFPDREPDVLAPQTVGAQRVRCIRMDEPIDGYQTPFGQYALKIEASTPVVCQIGRMDVQQPNLAYYTVMGCPA